MVPLVVSDGSEDDTAAVARAAGALVAELPIRRGGGLALRVGYDIALELGASVVVTMDADGQHRPEELATMVAPILAGEADYVNGSRMLGDFERESLRPSRRRPRVLAARDAAHRAPDHRPLERLPRRAHRPPTSTGAGAGPVLDERILIQALRHRARVVEVPVTFLARAGP